MKRKFSSVLKKPLTCIGIVFTVAYIALFVSTPLFGINDVVSLTLNELGDFLAGTFAPLALFWLVIGYFQHGQELRLNTEALRAQQEELRRQVEETAMLAKSAERQAEANEELATLGRMEQHQENTRRLADAQPIFTGGGGSSGGRFSQVIFNQGANVTDVEIEFPNLQHLKPEKSKYPIWKRDEKREIPFGSGLKEGDFPIHLIISYTDRLSNRGSKEFIVTMDHELRSREQDSVSRTLDDILPED